MRLYGVLSAFLSAPPPAAALRPHDRQVSSVCRQRRMCRVTRGRRGRFCRTHPVTCRALSISGLSLAVGVEVHPELAPHSSRRLACSAAGSLGTS